MLKRDKLASELVESVYQDIYQDIYQDECKLIAEAKARLDNEDSYTRWQNSNSKQTYYDYVQNLKNYVNSEPQPIVEDQLIYETIEEIISNLLPSYNLNSGPYRSYHEARKGNERA